MPTRSRSAAAVVLSTAILACATAPPEPSPPPRVSASPVEGIVVYADPDWGMFFLHQGEHVLRVEPATPRTLPAEGRRIRVLPSPTSPSEPLVAATIEDLGEGPLPPPQPEGDPRLATWCRVEGTVRRVSAHGNRLHLTLATERGRVTLVVPAPPVEADVALIGAVVRAEGVLDGSAEARRLFQAPPVWVRARAAVTVLEPAPGSEGIPTRSIQELERLWADGHRTRRVRLAAEVSSFLTDESALLDDGSGSIQAEIGKGSWIGDVPLLLGFLGQRGHRLVLEDAQAFMIGGDQPELPEPSPGATPLTTLADVRALPMEYARSALPVRAEGSITWLDARARRFFVQDGHAAVYLWAPRSDPAGFETGDRVLVEGVTGEGIVAPVVVGARLTRLGRDSWPPSADVVPTTADVVDLDCRRVTVQGTVRSVRWESSPNNAPDQWQPVLRLDASDRMLDVWLSAGMIPTLASLVDTEVRVTGTVHSEFNRARRPAGLTLGVSRASDVTVLERGVSDPFSLPVTAVTGLFRTGAAQPWGHRLRVRGTVLLQRPGTIFLRDDTGSVVVRSPLLLPTRPGDVLDVVGFPVPDPFAPGLEDASFRIESRAASPAPTDVSPLDLLSGLHNADLVRIEGSVLDIVRTPARTTVLVAAHDSILSAVLDSDAPGPIIDSLDSGALVRITGVVVGPTAAEQIALRSTADINILAAPPFWNAAAARNTLALFVLLVTAALLWALTLRRRVHSQTRTIEERLDERNTLIHELELRNAELERFTYTVSHDLKTPLVTIGGFLGLVEQDALSGNAQRLRADIKRIAEAADKMRRLLDELLQLSRAGRRLSTVEVLPLRQVVDEALSLVDTRSRNAEVQIQPDLPSVLGDRGRLVEVFQNLIENAVKYSGPEPTPTIEIGSLGKDDHGLVRVFVRDNGIGIPPEFHSRVFELFEKLDPSSQGTGVGLALVRRIVDAHGGHVSLESQGRGATFTLALPPGTTP